MASREEGKGKDPVQMYYAGKRAASLRENLKKRKMQQQERENYDGHNKPKD